MASEPNAPAGRPSPSPPASLRGAPAAGARGGADAGRLALHAGIAAAVVWVFARGVWRQWFLIDDAFISFRYARHLAEGLGPVYNVGERVEGYTNFLWVLLLAGGMRLGIAPEHLSLGLGVAAGSLLLGLVLWHAVRREGGLRLVCWVAPAALALSRSFPSWCTGGMATQLFALLVFAGFLAFLAERERAARPLASALLLGLAALTRPEGVLFGGVAGTFLAGEVALRRRPPRDLLLFGALLAGLVGAHVAWRLSYYGALLPNTFHAKVPGAWFAQGALYLGLFAEQYRAAWLLPLAGLGLALRPCAANGLFAAAVALHVLYVAYVGGDRFEFRFLVFVFPMGFSLVAEGVAAVADLGRGRAHPGARAAGASAAALAALVLYTSHRTATDPSRNRFRGGVVSTRASAKYAQWRTYEGQLLRGYVERGLLPRDLRLCVQGAGALPYYTRWYALDYHGLTDARVAREPVPERGIVAHERKASISTMRERGVEAFDVLDRMVYDGPPERIGWLGLQAFQHIADANAREKRSGGESRLRFGCRVLEPGRYLVFATPLPEEAVERRLGHLSACPR